jgi:hypothetical protein
LNFFIDFVKQQQQQKSNRDYERHGTTSHPPEQKKQTNENSLISGQANLSAAAAG